jgi:hypothetical protein
MKDVALSDGFQTIDFSKPRIIDNYALANCTQTAVEVTEICSLRFAYSKG